MAWRVFLGIIILLLWANQVTAQSDSAVRSELSSLRNRVSRLEVEIRRASSSSSNPLPRPTSTPRVVNGEAIGESDPMFERLATLVIELKEDVRELQKRVNVLENKNRS